MNTSSTTSPATFTPAPGAVPLPRMIAAQTGMELRALLRNGEQLLLMLIIPVLLLVLFSLAPLLDLGPGRRVDFLTPGILALAVLSTAFTGQAIGTGFERKYGVLKRLGATPLPRSGLLAAKTATVLVTEIGQVAVLCGVALALGWRPHQSGCSDHIQSACYCGGLYLARLGTNDQRSSVCNPGAGDGGGIGACRHAGNNAVAACARRGVKRYLCQ